MLALIVFSFGRVSGREFSPSLFTTREFRFHEIPWLHVQISPIRRTTLAQSPLTRYLITQSVIPVSSTTATDWHLVDISQGFLHESFGDAKLLTDHLDLSIYNNNQASNFWHEWSKKEKGKAAVLWPSIQKLASRELYLLIPKLLSLAIDTKTDQEFVDAMEAYLRLNYAELIVEMRAAGQNEIADGLLTDAITDYPDDAKLQELR